jgi:uncharacterized membrane protein
MASTSRSRLSVWWWELAYRIGPNLWVVPLVMSVASIALFNLTRWMDRHMAESIALPRLLSVETTGDVAIVLTALLGAVATALALVFSTTILTFSIASSQLGPRLIRRFMRDMVTQVTLGAFMATLIFLVLTLASVRTGRADGLPQVSAATGVLLSLGCFGMLVLYVHRVASTIQAPSVVAGVVGDLHRVLGELDTYLHEVPREHDQERVAAVVEQGRVEGAELRAVRTGYVELVDHPRMLDAAERGQVVILLERRPGQFVVEDQVIARVLPADGAEAVRRVVAEAVEIGPARTLRQDLEFAVAQVVEIALRALSPAVNDTFTGVTCIDWLGAAMVQLGRHPGLSGGMCSDRGELRLVVPSLRYERVMKAAFDQIRQAGDDNMAVLIRLLDAFTSMAATVRSEHLGTLRTHADLVLDTARNGSFVQGDMVDLEQRHADAVAAIDARDSAAG